MKYTNTLNKQFVYQYRTKQPPWGPLGYIVYKRTYARMTEKGVTEEWWETVARCCQGILDIGGIFTNQEIEQLYDMVFNLKCCFSGRALWQLGTPTVERVGADSLQNCWHVAIDRFDAFCFTMTQLMLGGGVGFNITPEHVYELPTIKYGVAIERKDENDVDFIVPDNREGWVKLLRKVLTRFFFTGKNLTYSTVCIRQKGKPIKSFGGTASGSEGLVKGISQISGILKSRAGYKLRPIDCLDILNIIASIVVAGNVRRSAELALGSANDELFLKAKSWRTENIPNWRDMSNNSVIINNIDELPSLFWDGFTDNNDPYGLINLDLCKSHGRLSDDKDSRPDYQVTGTNPCGEIPLESFEACNLFELIHSNLLTLDEFLTAAALGYKVCKTISAYPFSDNKINAVVERNHRLGVGATGILEGQWINRFDDMSTVYNSLEELDVNYSKELGVKESVKLTCVKPSGTVSLLPGCTSGIHPAYSRYYVRRIRFASNDPIVLTCKRAGYPTEPALNMDGSRKLDTTVVSFPIKSNAVVAKSLSAVEQLRLQEVMQNFWADNAVSMTCYYYEKELKELKLYLKENYSETIKTVAFGQHKEHGFKQAPYEEITSEKYLELVTSSQPITKIQDDSERDFVENLECESGSCPIR